MPNAKLEVGGFVISHDRDAVFCNGLWLAWEPGVRPQGDDRVYIIDDKGNGAFIRFNEIDKLVTALQTVKRNR